MWNSETPRKSQSPFWLQGSNQQCRSPKKPARRRNGAVSAMTSALETVDFLLTKAARLDKAHEVGADGEVGRLTSPIEREYLHNHRCGQDMSRPGMMYRFTCRGELSELPCDFMWFLRSQNLNHSS